MKTIHLLIGCLAILALSCNKHEVVLPPAPDGDALLAFHKNNVTDAEQHFVVNANAPISIVGEKGTILTLGANKLVDSDGNLVMGNVDVTLIEITKKSEMALLNKGTNGKKLMALELLWFRWRILRKHFAIRIRSYAHSTVGSKSKSSVLYH